MSIMDNTNTSDVSGTQEDNDGHNEGQSVIAQVVQAEEPTPGNNIWLRSLYFQVKIPKFLFKLLLT